MARIVTFLTHSFLILITLVRAEPSVVHHRGSRARAFIVSQCQTTLYPKLCVSCLSPYANSFSTTLSHQILAQIALKVTLARAESTRAYVREVASQLNQSKGKDYGAVMQCLDQINDGVEQLENSIKEAQRIRVDGQSDEFTWHASNVKTWMSTAFTDAGLCIDGLSGRAMGGKTKNYLKAKVLNLQQVTSNGMALFNRFAARYRSSNYAKKP